MARKRFTAEQIIGHLRQAEIWTSEGKTIEKGVRYRDLGPIGLGEGQRSS